MADQENISLAIVGVIAVVALLVMFVGNPTGALNVYRAQQFLQDTALIEGEAGTGSKTTLSESDLGHCYFERYPYNNLGYGRHSLLMEKKWCEKLCEELPEGSLCYWEQGKGSELSGSFPTKPIGERAGTAEYHREKKAEWS